MKRKVLPYSGKRTLLMIASQLEESRPDENGCVKMTKDLALKIAETLRGISKRLPND
jgi:hypothetical protein